MNVLWAYAHPKEAAGLVLPASLELGVGKVEAALRLTQRLMLGGIDAVVNFGVAGAYPGHGLDVGDLCLVAEESLLDEGVEVSGGFEDLASLGLGDAAPLRADVSLMDALAEHLGELPRVRGATVSTCSGTDELSGAYAGRGNPAIETMEGAAVARVCAHLGVPWAQVRAISNRTGERSRGGWDLKRATANLHSAMGKMFAHETTA